MKAGFVHLGGRHRTQATHDLHTGGDTAQHLFAAQPVALGGGQHGWHDHRTGVHWPAFIGVVKVLAVRGNAVHKRGGFHTPFARMAHGGAHTGLLGGGQGGLHIGFTARRQTNADHVRQQSLGRAARLRVLLGLALGDRLRQALGNSGCAHGFFPPQNSFQPV